MLDSYYSITDLLNIFAIDPLNSMANTQFIDEFVRFYFTRMSNTNIFRQQTLYNKPNVKLKLSMRNFNWNRRKTKPAIFFSSVLLVFFFSVCLLCACQCIFAILEKHKQFDDSVKNSNCCCNSLRKRNVMLFSSVVDAVCWENMNDVRIYEKNANIIVTSHSIRLNVCNIYTLHEYNTLMWCILKTIWCWAYIILLPPMALQVEIVTK